MNYVWTAIRFRTPPLAISYGSDRLINDRYPFFLNTGVTWF